jgi:hypothetical protein
MSTQVIVFSSCIQTRFYSADIYRWSMNIPKNGGKFFLVALFFKNPLNDTQRGHISISVTFWSRCFQCSPLEHFESYVLDLQIR